MLHTYNCYNDDDDGKLEVLHTHGSSKVPAGSFESDRLQEKVKQLINSRTCCRGSCAPRCQMKRLFPDTASLITRPVISSGAVSLRQLQLQGQDKV